MAHETEPRRRWLERPGRVAAAGGAAIVCLLSVSGALGLSPVSLQSSGSPQERLLPGGASTVGGSDIGSGGSGGSGATGGSGAAHARQPSGGPSTPGLTIPAVQSALPADSGSGKRVVFDESAQRVWLVASDNSVTRTYPVSGSKYDNLDLGTYQVNSRSRHATAYNSDETMQYMVRFAQGRTSPIGFHSIPAFSDGRLVERRSELGTPQSDGCVRQWITDARALWAFAPVGTTVVVRG